MQNRTSEREVFVELILRVESEEGLSLEREQRLILQSDTDIGTRINDALVGDGDDTHGIIHCIVTVLGEHNATGHNHHRPSRNIHGVEPDCGSAGCLIFSAERELVLVGELACHHESGVVKLVIDIILGDGGISDFPGEMPAERFSHREYDLAIARLDGKALDIVEKSVGIRFLIGVDTVEMHHLQQGLVCY